MIRPVLPQLMVSQAPQLVIDERQEHLERLLIPFSAGAEEFAELLGGS
jgi:hypothetical protein